MWSNITSEDGVFASSFGTILLMHYPSKNNNDNNYSDHLKNNDFFNI